MGNRVEKKAVSKTRDHLTASGLRRLSDSPERQTRAAGARVSERHYRRLFDSTKEGILVLDADSGRIRDLNPFLIDLLGCTRRELIGKNLRDIGAFQSRDMAERVFAQLRTAGQCRFDNGLLETKDGRRISLEIASSIYQVNKARFIQCHIRDITERKQHEEALRQQAFYDPLTDLPNRLLFTERLIVEMADAKRNHKKLAVLYVDLDRFKTVNDTMGHEIGDRLLRDVARRLRTCIRESDTAARIGGDEFNILLPDINSPQDTTISAGKIISKFNEPYLINDYELHVTGSIGISLYPNDGDTIDDLTRSADRAMFQAKESGRNTYRFYSPALDIRSHERRELEYDLRHAIGAGELVAYYQPQVDMRNRRIIGVEALVRWMHPALGMLAPSQFLALAEDGGLIQSIDLWMLRTACAQNKEWQRDGCRPVTVSVNVSARQFRSPDFDDLVLGVLRDTDLDPHFLILDLPEAVAMQNVESALLRVKRLAEHGVGFSIDDFGTGYTSINWLKKLPIQKIKIDESFIRNQDAAAADNEAVINAMIGLAHNLKLGVVAEGVEEERQVDLLCSCGCDEMQGYLFSRALPEEGIRPLLS